MNFRLIPRNPDEQRALLLASLIVLQALCALFFIGDVVVDLGDGEHLDTVHFALEILASVLLLVGVVFMMDQLRSLLRRMEELGRGIRAARGEMVEVVAELFGKWQLSEAERDVALFVLKGLDNETIARFRGTAQGTVRAQSAGIYKKAGVDNRAQLVSLFMEELFAVEPGEAGSSEKP